MHLSEYLRGCIGLWASQRWKASYLRAYKCQGDAGFLAINWINSLRRCFLAFVITRGLSPKDDIVAIEVVRKLTEARKVHVFPSSNTCFSN